MKKRLSAVLSVLLTFAMLGTPVSFAVSGDQFTDVDAGAWYKADVDFVAENNYMIGTSDTTFEPQSNLTRAMFATILARYDGAEVDNSKATIFTDVEVNKWFTGSIGWANEKEIVKGVGENQFAPMSNITRQDLAVMVERYITYVESTTDKVHVTPGVAIAFTDADQISDYAQEAMDKAVIHGLIIGYPDGSVKPLQYITRAECAAIIHRIQWKKGDGEDSHTVTTYDAEGNKTDTEVPAGEVYTVPEGPAKDGAEFVKWNTSPDGTGTSYNPGDKIIPTEDISLYPIYKSGGGGGGGDVPESHNYTVTASLVRSGSEKDAEAILTKTYKIGTKAQDNAITIDKIMDDLISGDNKTAIKNGLDSVIDYVKKNGGTKTVEIGGDTYTITTTEDAVVSALKNGEQVDLPAELAEEREIFLKKTQQDSPDVNGEDFTNAFFPGDIFEADGMNLKLKDADGCYEQVKEAVDYLKAERANLFTVEQLEAFAALADRKEMTYNDYTIDEVTGVKTLYDLQSDFEHISSILTDQDGVLLDLMKNKTTYTGFEGTESVNSMEDAVQIINERTSRNLSNSPKIQAVLQAILKAYSGDYTFTLTVEKK